MPSFEVNEDVQGLVWLVSAIRRLLGLASPLRVGRVAGVSELSPYGGQACRREVLKASLGITFIEQRSRCCEAQNVYNNQQHVIANTWTFHHTKRFTCGYPCRSRLGYGVEPIASPAAHGV